MMAPNAVGGTDSSLHDHQDHGAYQSYSPENYSDSELDAGRGKGTNGKPRTRLGYQRISIACCMPPATNLRNSDNLVYCRRRKIRCLPPVGDGDRCQNCARQQRECVVQPIAGSTRKGGRNQANALSTEPMPYAEALSMTRQNNTLAHRRASKPSDRYPEHAFYPTIAVPPYYLGNQSMGVPMSAPAHSTQQGFLPGHHAPDTNGYSDVPRRPPFKHMQSAPAGMYSMHHNSFDRSPATQDTYSGQWQQNPGPPHYNVPQQDSFHPPSQEISSDPSNAFWKLSVTSPTATPQVALPPPRLQSGQWTPNADSNYTHERPATLPTPHHVGESQPFPNQQPFFSPPMTTPTAPLSFQTQHSNDEHCDTGSHWSRSTASTYRTN